MNSNQVMFSNTQQHQNVFGMKNVNQHSVRSQKQKPKPPVRQFRQNSGSYNTLQQPSSKMMQALPNTQMGDDSNNDWTFSPFEVIVQRNSLGLGLSIMGGPDANFPFSKLIRIKKIFPLQPAWETGRLKIGDILLSAGGVPLSALTIRQAIDVLRSSHTGTVTRLVICRPPPDNYPSQIFDEIFNKANAKETRTPEKKMDKSDMFDRPKTVHRSYSTCISTTINENNMIQCGTPSKGPLSISLFPSNQSTTIFCPSSPTKPKRNTTDKHRVKTNIADSDYATQMHVSTSKVDLMCQSNRSSSPMDFEDCQTSDLSMALDDSVQSFTQSNGINGPVYVDNSPERDEDKRLAHIDDIIPSDKDSLKENFNTINEIESSKTTADEERVYFSSKITNGKDHMQKIGTLDLLKEIPTTGTTLTSNGETSPEKYGEFSINIKKVS